MKDILNDSDKENLVSINGENENGKFNIAWYVYSILTWFLLLCIELDAYLNDFLSFNNILNIDSKIFFLPMASSKIFIFCMNLFGFIIYLIFTTCKRDENLLNSMMSTKIRFHFIPFLFILLSFIFSSNTFFNIRNKYLLIPSIVSLISGVFGCVLLSLIYSKTNIPCEWYIVLPIKKGCFSCLITYSWFLIIYDVISICTVKITNENTIKVLVIVFIIVNSLGALSFSLIFKDLLVLLTSLFIYRDLIANYFSTYGTAAGVIVLVLMALFIAGITLLVIFHKDKLFK